MSNVSSAHDLLELSRHLKQERLFINSEREQLQSLNEDVAKSAENLYHVSWISRQQKHIVDRLILGDKDITPLVCCQRSNMLEKSNFVDGYRHLGYHESKFGEFLKQLREHPKLVASCLVSSERSGSSEDMQKMSKVVMASLYGNMVMPEDEHYALELLRSLVDLQLASSDNPRRLVRKGSCAFSGIFKLFTEGLFSAKLFLTAALHKPVMQLLMEDEWFYDIDPQRALYRFPPQERVKRFSSPGTEEYELRTKQYREVTTNKLVALTERFINSIKENMYCFPQSLGWMVAQLYANVRKAQKVTSAEARAMCADLVFAFFICPAVCDPEPYGITSDAPISYIARHNLMQVAQMLQVLAISSWEEIDPKLRDVYGKFERGCVSSLLDSLLEGGNLDQPLPCSVQMQGCTRVVVLISLPQLLDLIQFLRNQTDVSNEVKKQLEEMLSWLPPPATIQSLMPTPSTTPQPTPPGTPPISAKKEKSHGIRSQKRRLMLTPDLTHEETDDSDVAQSQPPPPDDVLVISLGIINECPGMLSEHRVMEQDTRQRKVRYNNMSSGGEDESSSGPEVPLQEKRTRFSLSHDQDSIATSDNLEAISEAASSHSPVGSDIETENDNLSDMVSANVSGRGTPNISGRDTPISQADSQAESVEERRAPDLPVIVQKNNREDVTERFGKFEIKSELERDEAKSTVSDTWSTDVLAGDSEPSEQNQMERLEEVAEEVISQNLLAVQEILEVSETASDAWSTDVLASDTSEKQAERLLELDQDETASVSSRSQGPESEAGDPQDQNEDTPQPSGSQSPNEAMGLGRHNEGAVGGRLPYTGGMSGAISGGSPDNLPPPSNFYNGRLPQDVRGLPHPRPHPQYQHGLPQVSHAHRPDRISSDPMSPLAAGGRDVIQECRPMLPPSSDNRRNFAFTEASRFNPMQQQPHLQGQRPNVNKGLEGKSMSVLVAFDPLTPEKVSREASPSNSDKSLMKSTGGSTLGSSTQTLVPDSLVSPDQGIASPGNDSTSPSDPQHSHRESDRDSGVPPTPQDSMDTLSNDVSEGLKLTEQQNFNIDANRLSGLSGVLNFLDPLLPEGASESLMARSRSSTDTSGITILRNNPITRLLEQMPRPRAASSGAPRITVQGNESVSSWKAQRAERGLTAPAEVGRGTTCDFDLLGDHPDHGDPSLPEEEKRHSDSSYMSSNEFATKSRSSTESSTSSLVEVLASSSGGKSVGFETPSKEDREDDEKGTDSKKKSSFFRTFKERLSKGGRRKPSKQFDRDEKGVVDQSGAGDKPLVDINGGDDILNKYKTSTPQRISGEPVAQESSDDILAKYRKHPSALSSAVDTSAPSSSGVVGSKDKTDLCRRLSQDEEDSQPAYDPSNLAACKAFLDAKKKLRLVLSTADFQSHPLLGACGGYGQVNNNRHDTDLVSFLKIQLAEAINLQDKDLIAQLHETIRCLRQFDNEGMRKLLRAMRDEYKARAPYIAYLVRCRQGLLSTLAHIDRLQNRVKRDKAVCNKYFLSVFIRLFLEQRERALMRFIADFQKLTMPDEKTELVDQFLEYLYKQMEQDAMWQSATEGQMNDAKIYIERNVMSHIYTHAMFPNGDGDILRDQILHDHIAKLSKVITPNHSDLRVPKIYHYECPWPAAQAEIYMINAYKTPKDKLQCVLRCSSTIMNLLSMANEKSVPAADDFMPVLIYVLIKANPQSLLSTIQYVTSFYDKRLQGEEQYWWMQFCAGVEFVKTMDYND